MLPVKAGSILDHIGSIPNPFGSVLALLPAFQILTCSVPDLFLQKYWKKEFPKIEKYETAATHTYKVCVDTGITYHLGKNLGEGVSANPSQ